MKVSFKSNSECPHMTGKEEIQTWEEGHRDTGRDGTEGPTIQEHRDG